MSYELHESVFVKFVSHWCIGVVVKEKSEKKAKVSVKKAVVKPAKKTLKKKGGVLVAGESNVAKEVKVAMVAEEIQEMRVEKTAKETKVVKEARVGKESAVAKENLELKVDLRHERYWEAVGRRKTAVARVRLFTRGDKGIWINGKPLGLYFLTEDMRRIAEDALRKMKAQERFRVTVKANGGGLHAQAEAVRHGTARALTKFNPDFRKRLKRAGFLIRDPRMVERKKFGLKKARRAPQWAKR